MYPASLLTILNIVYWLLMVAGYSVVVVGWSCIAWAIIATPLWWTDRKRQSVRPTRHEYSSSPLNSHFLTKLPRRQSSLFARSATEPVARLSEVISRMQTGDILDFCGRKPHSYINRIARWCRSSHSAMVYVDASGNRWVAEVVERLSIIWNGWKPSIDFGGFRLVRIESYVAKYPGQLYWARIADIYAMSGYTIDGRVISPRFDRAKAAAAIEASRTWGYGWGCIGLQIIQVVPLVNVAVYLATWKSINTAWAATHASDCSCAVSLWCEAAGEDPVPGLAAQLTTPAEIERTKLTDEPVALVT